MGQHSGALKVLLNLTKVKVRYAHLQKPLLHVDGIPFTDKDHKCINITKLEGLASYCKAEPTFTFHFSILTL